MRFNLKSSFVLIAAIGLGLGWISERWQRLATNQSQIRASRTMGAAINTTYINQQIQTANKNVQKVLDEVLLMNLIDIWRDQIAISQIPYRNPDDGRTSQAYAAMILEELNCATSQDLLSKLTAARERDCELNFPEYELSDAEVLEFSLFLDDSLK